jgi:hypothetical protein
MTDSLFDKLKENAVLNEVRALPPIPETVTSFLGRLFLLHGVPFHYLFPDEKLLEPETLKFFYIDREWIAALINGALSVGHEEVTRDYQNKAMAVKPYIDEAREIRKRARPETAIATEAGIRSENPESQRFTGFLLRSRLLAGWEGIQIRAFQNKRQLPILRLDRVDRVEPVLLFGLVDGELDELDITQPPEGLHFELQQSNNGTIWRDQADGVLDLLGLRNSLGLNVSGGAEFAKSMLAQQLRGVFTLEPEKPG